MSRSNKPKTFENYFEFFENKSKNLTKYVQLVLVAGIAANILLIVLFSLGVVRLPERPVLAHPTPAPEPTHFVGPSRVKDNS